MEVMMGPTFSIEVSAPAEYVRDRGLPQPLQPSSEKMPSSAAAGSSAAGFDPGRSGSGIWPGQMAEYSSESSSSIGSPGNSDEEEEDDSGEDDAVSSKEHRLRGLGSLSSLEDSLPIKRGLSNHYKGKSKSFGNLAEISSSSAKEVEKQENPLNKRRRLQICNKWSRRSFYAWQNPKSMPLLPVNEDDDDDEEDERDLKCGLDEAKSVSSSSDEECPRKSLPFKSRGGGFKSRSCFALSDLQEEDDDQ